MKIRRISFFAGPSAGKTAVSSWLFSELKKRGYEVEHVAEYCKAWAFIGRCPTSFDQVYIAGKQMHKEDIVLRNGISTVISESPLFLGVCYAEKYNAPCSKHLLNIINEFEETYPSLNIFLDRGDLEYKTIGRFQTYEEALEMDRFILSKMDETGMKYYKVKTKDEKQIMDLCLSHLGPVKEHAFHDIDQTLEDFKKKMLTFSSKYAMNRR